MADKDTNIFTDIASGKPSTLMPGQVIAAREWFRRAAQKITDIDPQTIFSQMAKSMIRTINISHVGSMFMYQYTAKYAKTLPYYDTYPLIFVVGMTPGGWTGLNLHYLPPYQRAQLMNALYTITTKESDKMKVQMSYTLLNSASKFKLFKPCYHKYLANHVQSKLLFIEQSKWDTALMLPTARFVGASEQQVWKDSKRIQ